MKKYFKKIRSLVCTLFAPACFYLSFMPCYGIEDVITLDEAAEPPKIKLQLSLDEPKKVIFSKGFIEEFTPALNFQGVYKANFNDEKSNFTYPFSIEGGGNLKFNEGKGKIRVTSNFSRDVDGLNNKFLGKISDIYFEHKLNENHRVLIGNSRIPIGMEGAQSQYRLLFTERAQISSNFGNARAAGVRFRGDFGHIEYDLGGYSSTRLLQNIADGAEFAGWINCSPFYNKEADPAGDEKTPDENILKDFKIGAGINTGVRGSSYTVLGVGAKWNYKRLSLISEYAYADGSNASKYNGNERGGFYAAAAYNITDKIQAAGRYDFFDTNTNKSDDTIQKYTLGLNYYLIGQRLRFSVNYTYTQNGSAVQNQNDGNSIHFMTQVMI